MVDEYRKILEEVAMISSQKELNMGVGDVECTPPHLPSLQNNYYFNKFMVNDPLQNLNKSNLSDLAQQEKADESHVTSSNLSLVESIKINEETCDTSSLRDVSKPLDSLTHQFEKHQTESNIVLNDLINTLDVFKSSNSTNYLAQENTLDSYKCVVSELNQKLTAAENDKASLLTAIRLLNEDRALNHANANSQINSKEPNQVNQTANPGLWHAATSSSNIKSNSNQHQPLPLQNKYSVLRVADEENLEVNEDVAAKQATEISQSVSDKSSLKESACNKKRGRNKGAKTNTVIVSDSINDQTCKGMGDVQRD